MKSYEETVKYLGEMAFHAYMSGSNETNIDYSTVSFIFDVPSNKIYLDVQEERKRLVHISNQR